MASKKVNKIISVCIAIVNLLPNAKIGKDIQRGKKRRIERYQNLRSRLPPLNAIDLANAWMYTEIHPEEITTAIKENKAD